MIVVTRNMENYLRATIVSPSRDSSKEKLFKREKVIGSGGTSIVATYRAEDGERVVVKVSYCGKPDAMATGSREAITALDVSDPKKTDCASAGYSLCSTCRYTAEGLLRRPLSYKYEAPCFYSVYPYVESNLAQWLNRHPKRDPKQVRDFFLQILTVLRCLRTRKYYYSDIKPTNFLVVYNSEGIPHVEIGDLGGLVAYGDKTITISPGQLPDDVRSQLSWPTLDTALSVLLGALLLQMLIKSVAPSDAVPPLIDFFACLRGQATEICKSELLTAAKTDLAAGISTDDPLSLDLISVALLLIGVGGLRLQWQDVPSLDSPINSI